MKIMKYISLFFFVAFLGSCTVTLMDETGNAFNVTATQGKYDDKVEVTWTQTPYFKSYQVFRSDSETGLYYLISDERQSATLFNDVTIEAGKKYYYKVEGFNKLDIPSFTTEPAEGYGGGSSGLQPPSNVIVNTGASSTTIKLEWNTALGAATYEIKRKKEDEFNYSVIANIVYTQYEDKDVELGVNYCYQISSLDENGGYSAGVSSVGPVSLFGGDFGVSSSAGVYTDKIVLTWTIIPNTTKYHIYRSENEASVGIKIATIEANPRSDILNYEDNKDVYPNVLYYYTIIYGNDTVQERSFSIRGFLYSNNIPKKVENFTVSRDDSLYVNLSWTAPSVSIFSVGGQNDISYEVARSVSAMGPWVILSTNTTTSYQDQNLPKTQYSYFYKITTLKKDKDNNLKFIVGQESTVVEGWANKAPVNITASDVFSRKVVLSWDKVPTARSYEITYSLTENGTYKSLPTVNAGGTGRITYDHDFNIGNKATLDLFYKIRVIFDSGLKSAVSDPIKGQLNTIGTPQNIILKNNRGLTKNIQISWDAVPNAGGYVVYVATLAHRNSQYDRLKESDYKRVGTSRNPTYIIAFGEGGNPPLYPIRRHAIMIKSVESDATVEVEGAGAKVGDAGNEIYRLPTDATDFAKDVDFTIIQAQTQIADFGAPLKNAIIYGRASGRYVYSSGLPPQNEWHDYISFEIILEGTPKIQPTSATSGKMNGSLNITGLYTGTINYQDLVANSGIGVVVSGRIIATYNGNTRTLTMPGDANVLDSTYTAAPKPSYPSYIKGGG